MPYASQVVRIQGQEQSRLRPRRRKAMDNDLQGMSRERLVAEVIKLRQGIRSHRDSSGHELCWHHPALWELLPERTAPQPVVPESHQFLPGCKIGRASCRERVCKYV